jgi:hypothetical protein
MNRRGTTASIFLLSTVLIASSVAQGAQISLLSNVGTGQDGMVYSNPSVPFPVSAAFPAIAVAKTALAAHDTVAFIKFDVHSTGLTPALVQSAVLKVNSVNSNVVNGTNQNPDPTHVIDIDISAITSTWNRNSVTWATKPSHGAVGASFGINGVGQAFTVDVTSFVQTWLAGLASANHGLWLESPTIVGS